jgi:monoamine oxidase
MSGTPSCDVVIVGAGVAGASAAYYLAQKGVTVVVVEAGAIGRGDEASRATINTHDAKVPHPHDEQHHYHPYRSGSAVMHRTSTIKMMCSLYPSSSRDFIAHHGKGGAAQYLRLAALGIGLEKRLAKKLLPDASSQLRELGALYVAHACDRQALLDEFQLLHELGLRNIEWCDKDKVHCHHHRVCVCVCVCVLSERERECVCVRAR